jgi:hypothetical protein
LLQTLAAFAALAAPASRASAASYAMSYAVQFIPADGTTIDGNVDVRVTFYDAATGGSALGEPRRFTGVATVGGVVQLSIELTDAEWHALIPSAAGERWVEFVDETHNLSTPRQRFGIVPYALKVPVDGTTLGYDSTTGALAFEPTAAVDMHGQRVTGLADPSDPGDAVTRQYLEQALADIPSGGGGGGGGGGTVTSVTGTAPIVVSSTTTTPQISIAAATGATNGYLKSTDWTTFNDKQAALGFTPLDSAGGSLSGALDMTNHAVKNVAAPSAPGDAASKDYVDQYLAGQPVAATAPTTGQALAWSGTEWSPTAFLTTDGGTLSGELAMSSKRITGLGAPLASSDAATQKYVDDGLAAKQATISASTALAIASLATSSSPSLKIGNDGTTEGEARFYELTGNGAQYVALKAPSSVAANATFTLPAAAPSTDGQVLSSTAQGVLSWAAPGTAPVSSVNGSTGAVVLTAADIGALAASTRGAVSGVAALDGSSKVVQDPANAQAAAAVGKIPVGSGSSGELALSWLPATLTGKSADTLDGIDSTSFVRTTRVINAGMGLTGGGDFSADRSLALAPATSSVLGGIQATAGKLSVDANGVITSIVADSAATAGNVTGTVDLAHGGTGAVTQAGAANAVLPPQTSQAGRFLTTDGANVSWGSAPAPNALQASDGTPSQALLVDANGQVGIGTTSPGTMLHVSKPWADETSIMVENTNTGAGSMATVEAVVNVAAAKGVSMTQYSAQYNPLHTADSAGLLAWTSSSRLTIGTLSATAPVIFHTGGDNPVDERMRIDAAGNVGIRTINPGYPLDVTGTVRATDVIATSYKLNIASTDVTDFNCVNGTTFTDTLGQAVYLCLGGMKILQATTRPHMVFTTSTSYTGNLGSYTSENGGNSGIAAADAICRSRAAASTRTLISSIASTFKAIISSSTIQAVFRIRFLAPTFLVTTSNTLGSFIGTDASDFFGAHALNEGFIADENGNSVAAVKSWTGSTGYGMAADTNCANWSSAASGTMGTYGTANDKVGWLNLNTQGCNLSARLYCASQ